VRGLKTTGGSMRKIRLSRSRIGDKIVKLLKVKDKKIMHFSRAGSSPSKCRRYC
jgi:hypothetical protein